MANIQRRGERSWLLTVYQGWGADKKYVRKTKTIRIEDDNLLKTTKKLQDYLDGEYAKFKQEIEEGIYIAPQRFTFGAFVEEWKEKYAIKHLEAKTYKNYISALNAHILPVFKDMKLEAIKPMHILSFLESLGKEGARKSGKGGVLSQGAIALQYRVIRNVLNCAVDWKLIKKNPATSVKQPKMTTKEIEPYSEEEVNQLMAALKNAPYHWRMLISLALATGMRLGEMLGLEWKHIDWNTCVIDVVQSLTRSVDGVPQLKEPKTKNSKRKVALPASMIDSMKEYYLYRMKERDQVKEAWKGGDHFFVFAHYDGTPFNETTPSHWFKDFLKRNGFRHIRLHDLRHTSATLLINQGVHAKIISQRLGHANITTTMNVYGHALATADHAAANKFDNIVNFKNL